MIAQRGAERVGQDDMEFKPVLPPQRIVPDFETIPWNIKIFSRLNISLVVFISRLSYWLFSYNLSVLASSLMY